MAYFVILLIVVVLGRWAWLIAGLIAYGAGYHFMGPALAVVFALTLIVPPTPRGARNRR